MLNISEIAPTGAESAFPLLKTGVAPEEFKISALRGLPKYA